MSRLIKSKMLWTGLAMGLAFRPDSALACAACYGANVDTPLTQGMNWGIFSLLAVIGCVLGGVAGFAVFLAKKAAATPLPVAPALSATQNA